MISKKWIPVILVILFQLSAFGNLLWAFEGTSDLDTLKHAHSHMEKGDYQDARSLLHTLLFSAKDQYIRLDAAYFQGFCSVRLNDSFQAREDFEDFLREFDKPSPAPVPSPLPGIDIPFHRFIPDALYGLGRVCEDLGRKQDAVYHYRYCLKRFPESPFAEKSRERLSNLGEEAESRGSCVMKIQGQVLLQERPETDNPEWEAAQSLKEAVSRLPGTLTLKPDGSFDQNQLDLIAQVMEAGTHLYKLDIIGPNGRLIIAFLKEVDITKFNYFQLDLVSANRSWKRANACFEKIYQAICGK